MNVHRQNILDLIGSKANRYHSCILTTFSFDFHFFEWKVMKCLRSSGISNVNILIDGQYYSELMTNVTGDEMKHSPGYSLYPIFHDTIFHPKLWLLFGEREGLLIIGSGNLTNAGNGTNDEIWGAFHIDGDHPENESLFASAWQYVQRFCLQSQGLFKEKTTQWLRDNSKWLADLPQPAPGQWVTVRDGRQAAFLHNAAPNGIWNQLLALTGQKAVTRAIVVSPYYDRQGKALAQVRAAFPAAAVQVVLDERGSIPSGFTPDEGFQFFSWADAGLNDRNSNRLHAKLIHLATETGAEYCLFGSANMTTQGMGLDSSANEEASLLVKAPAGALAERLALTLDTIHSKPISLFKAASEDSNFQHVFLHRRYPIQLMSAELLQDSLQLYLSGTSTDEFTVELTNGQNRRIAFIPGFRPGEAQRVNVAGYTDFQFVQVWSANGQTPVSNKILITDYITLLKTNPDPRAKEIEEIRQHIESGELSRVLDLLQYALLDRDEQGSGTTYAHGSGNPATAVKNTQDEGLYSISEFKEIDLHAAFSERHLLLSGAVRVLEIIQSLPTKPTRYYDTIREDEQVGDIAKLSGQSEDAGNEKKAPKLLRDLQWEQQRLRAYFKNIHKEQLVDRYGKGKEKPPRTAALSIRDVAKYLIALELLLEYGGCTESYQDGEQERHFQYLPYTGESYDITNVKGCCLCLIGYFLELVKLTFRKYESEIAQSKLRQLCHTALVKTIVCLLNTKWQPDEERHLIPMLLNTMHYLGLKTAQDLRERGIAFLTEVTETGSTLKHPCPFFSENLRYFQTNVWPVYEDTVQRRERKYFDKDIKRGNYLYKSPFGYCYVWKVEKNTNGPKIYVAKPGNLFDTKVGEFVLNFTLEDKAFIRVEI